MSENKVGRKVVLSAGLNNVVYDDGNNIRIDEDNVELCYTFGEGDEAYKTERDNKKTLVRKSGDSIKLGTLNEIKKERDKKRKDGQQEKFKDELFVDDLGHDDLYKLQENLSRYSIGKISDFGYGGKKRLYVCPSNNNNNTEVENNQEKEKEMENQTLNESKGGKRKSRRHRKSKKSRKGKSRKNRRKSNRRCR